MHFGSISGLILLALMVMVEGRRAPNATFHIRRPEGKPRMVPEQPYCWDKEKTDYTFTISCDEPAWYAWADCDRRRYTSPLMKGPYRVQVRCVSPIADCGAYAD
ncbi:hypothetical protein BGZ70_002809 [Mortierella alpina]|uniref:Uncharacterized protein n=1 Tax=Mortierella alpina TaxID=64518 RepID=A0A9P6IU14_MORAP|nr:hypothetical protein BGZ70_002809 [Mortierella alpina]